MILLNSSSIMNHEYFMQLAIEAAKKGKVPYGAAIVKDNQVLAVACNTVIKDSDSSAHGEINALRSLTTKLQQPYLEGYSLYTTAEPCPMCAAACVWTGISEIIYGVSIQDLISINQVQINIACDEIVAKSFRKINIIKGILKPECLELFNDLMRE